MIKVIFHVDEMEKWTLALHNVQNMLNALEGRDLTVEVLANSEAVRFYTVSDHNAASLQMSDLAKAGVLFAACNNALNSLGIQKDQLPEFIQVVPAGVLELAEKQQQGYAYIKP
jgi:intracellular sulfur oxidation DsrE/DsrF family protein